MTKAVVFDTYGTSDILKISELQDIEPGPNEVLIKQEAIGVNYHDILYRRSECKKIENLPTVLGFEAAGIVQSVGTNVHNFNVGQKVAYATAPIGAYRSQRCVDQNYVIAVPDELNTHLVAACLFKGLVAHTLLFRTYFVRVEDTILIHSAASGVGSIMTQWASSSGVKVIGTVGTDAKKEVALKNGCMQVFNRKAEDWVKGVLDLTGGKGVKVIYDSVGVETFNDSIRALSKFGFLVLFGESSGKVATVNLGDLESKSLFLSIPSVFDYKMNRMELILAANEIFDKMKSGLFKEQISASFNLADVSKAHDLIESGQNINSIILY
ncbi:MAG: quinone oxidoreductase [Candidatus Midichloria sp.]|nr:quinone oxidoreductase [Candidatus Midichloria sp.]